MLHGNLSFQLTALMKENSLLKERLLERDMGNQERQEMERQVNRTKEELFSEQKKFRGKVDSLQEVIMLRKFNFSPRYVRF